MVSAFQNVSARYLIDRDHESTCDVRICGDDPINIREGHKGLAPTSACAGLFAGSVRNPQNPKMTSLPITIRRRHKITESGIQVTRSSRVEFTTGSQLLRAHTCFDARHASTNLS